MSNDASFYIVICKGNLAQRKLDKLNIIHHFPFISAFGIKADPSDCIKIQNMEGVCAIVSQSYVTTEKLVTCNHTGCTFFPELMQLHKEGIDGKDITCAVIDTGIHPHLDFFMPKKRVLFMDFVNGEVDAYDDNGHGTAVSGILCGNGLVSGGCARGSAPKAELISLKAVGQNGEGGTFAILNAMQWIFDNRKKYAIKVLNMSFGTPPAIGIDPLKIGAETLWKSGVVVVSSAGNSGPKSETIMSPGCSPHIITVGGAAKYSSGWNVVDFSSRGPSGANVKPDIIAPALNIETTCHSHDYNAYSGTSMAAPLIAGICALICQKNPHFSPNKIKELLLTNATKLNCLPNHCGKGLIGFGFLQELLHS